LRFSGASLAGASLLVAKDCGSSEDQAGSSESREGTLKIHTYASPDPDSVNTHWIETTEGIGVIGAQRQLSESRKALAQIERVGKPIIGMFVTVPHTDHFGGLGVFSGAYPDAPVYAAPGTIKSIEEDEGGFIESRKEILGDDFPSRDEVVVPDRQVEDEEELRFGGLNLMVRNLPNNNASVNTLLYLPNHDVLFSSEVVENATTPFMFERGTENWIGQVETLPEDYPSLQTIYPAHNYPGPADFLMRSQREYLVAFRDLVQENVSGDGELSREGRDAVVAEMETLYPDYKSVARLPRDELLALNADWLAEELGG